MSFKLNRSFDGSQRLPDFFQNDYRMWIIEMPSGSREYVRAEDGIVGMAGARHVVSIPYGRIFQRVSDDGFFIDDTGLVHRLESKKEE